MQSSRVGSHLRGNDNLSSTKLNFIPRQNWSGEIFLNKYSSSCIDTSDGVLSSLDQLMRLNNVGFKFRNDWNETLDQSSKQFFNNYNLPLWLLLAGEHGEFELFFSIPSRKRN